MSRPKTLLKLEPLPALAWPGRHRQRKLMFRLLNHSLYKTPSKEPASSRQAQAPSNRHGLGPIRGRKRWPMSLLRS